MKKKYLILLLLLPALLFAQKKKKSIPTEKPVSTPAKDLDLSIFKMRSIGPAFMSGRIIDLAFNPTKKSEYYVAVASGGVFKTTNGGITFIEPVSSEIPETFSLEQNYPNPFNPNTHFGFRIADFGLVNLSIYDAAGKKIETLVNEELKPGTYEVDWDASAYSSGVYFYTLISGDFTKTRKMVLMK